MSTPLFLAFLALFGVVVGSFLNVVIVRIPGGESLMKPPSKCPLCETPIEHRDNIPVVSWLLLRGKCRHCSEPIPVGYPLVEAGNALLWVVAGIRFGQSWALIPYAILFSVLLALSVIDLELYILPNRITYPAIIASIIAIPILSYGVADDPGKSILFAYLGGLGFAGILVFTLMAWELIMHKEGMGMGDVKLALLLGIWLGWLHPVLPLYALIVSSVVGLVVGGVILAVRRESRAFPFGPWLALGSVIVILWAVPILRYSGYISDADETTLRATSTSFEVRAGQ